MWFTDKGIYLAWIGPLDPSPPPQGVEALTVQACYDWSLPGAVVHICNISTLYLQMENRQKNHLEACRPVNVEYLLISAETVGEILSQKQGGRERLLTVVLLHPHMVYGKYTCAHTPQ